MRIESRAPIATAATNRPRTTTGARFSADSPAGAMTPPAPANSLMGLDAVLALQSDIGDGRERRRKAVQRGRHLLDSLESLKLALLSGRLSPSDIARLSRHMGVAEGSSGDPRLDEIIAHIELRAGVELAKLGVR